MKHLRTTTLILGMLCLLCTAAHAQSGIKKGYDRIVNGYGMTFQWNQDPQLLTGHLQAPTQGWMTITFRSLTDPAKTASVTTRIVNEEGEVLSTAGPTTLNPKLVGSVEDAGQSSVEFSLQLQPLMDELSLKQGDPMLLILSFGLNDSIPSPAFVQHQVWTHL